MGQEEKSEADEADGLSMPAAEYAVVSRLVATERRKVRWMYREEPTEPADTGWRFFSGDEAEDFGADQENCEFHALDTVIEIDPSVAPYLNRTAPVAFERDTPDAPFTEVA